MPGIGHPTYGRKPSWIEVVSCVVVAVPNRDMSLHQFALFQFGQKARAAWIERCAILLETGACVGFLSFVGLAARAGPALQGSQPETILFGVAQNTQAPAMPSATISHKQPKNASTDSSLRPRPNQP